MCEGLTDQYTPFAYGLRKAGEAILGPVTPCHRSEWQVDNAPRLAALAAKKQEAYAHHGESATAHQHHRRVRKQCKKEVCAVLNEWWLAQAQQIDEATIGKRPEQPYLGIRQLRRTLGQGRKTSPKLRDNAINHPECPPCKVETTLSCTTQCAPLLLPPLSVWLPMLCVNT